MYNYVVDERGNIPLIKIDDEWRIKYILHDLIKDRKETHFTIAAHNTSAETLQKIYTWCKECGCDLYVKDEWSLLIADRRWRHNKKDKVGILL